ncbi:MAG: hypothetical protein AB7N76_01765 [Planctomycetota bacterium]
MSDAEDTGNCVIAALVGLGLFCWLTWTIYESGVEGGQKDAHLLIARAQDVRKQQVAAALEKDRAATNELARRKQELLDQRGPDDGATAALARAVARRPVSPQLKLLMDRDLDLPRVVSLACVTALANAPLARDVEVERGRRGFRLVFPLDTSQDPERTQLRRLADALRTLPEWIAPEWVEQASLSRAGADPLAFPLTGFPRLELALEHYLAPHRPLPAASEVEEQRLGSESGISFKNARAAPLEGELIGARGTTRLSLGPGAQRGGRCLPGPYLVRLRGGDTTWLGFCTLRAGLLAQVELR